MTPESFEKMIMMVVGAQVGVPLLKYLGDHFFKRTMDKVDAVEVLGPKMDSMAKDVSETKSQMHVVVASVANHTTELAVIKDRMGRMEGEQDRQRDRLHDVAGEVSKLAVAAAVQNKRAHREEPQD